MPFDDPEIGGVTRWPRFVESEGEYGGSFHWLPFIDSGDSGPGRMFIIIQSPDKRCNGVVNSGRIRKRGARLFHAAIEAWNVKRLG